MAASSTLKMVYKLYDDTNMTISLKDPKVGLTLTEVQTAAETCLTKEAFLRNNVLARSLSDAYIQKTEQIELED